MAWLGPASPSIDIEFPARNCAIAIQPADRKDDVKLSGALQRLLEEDGGLLVEHDETNHEIRLRGVNEEHLNTVLARLKRRYGVGKSHPPAVGYRESIRKPVRQHGRHKKQSGGHGQFGDVIIEIRREPRRGLSLRGEDPRRSVPKQWIPAVEDGVREAMRKGPLGFNVVDVAVSLVDGSYSVDSSELAFRLAGRLAMRKHLPRRSPLLEPMHKITVVCPSSATNNITSARRCRTAQADARHGTAGRLDRLGPRRSAAPRSGAERPRGRAAFASQGLATMRPNSTIWPS